MAKARKLRLKVCCDPTNPIPIDYLSEMISNVLGYDVTQAYTCASLVCRTGSYIIKTYKPSDVIEAEEATAQLKECGVSAMLI